MLKALLRHLGFEEAAHRSVLVPLLEAQVHELQADRDYWKRVAERLLDAALLKRGDVTQPVFQSGTALPEEFRTIFSNMAAESVSKHDT